MDKQKQKNDKSKQIITKQKRYWLFIKLDRLEQQRHSEHLCEVNATLGDQTINDKVKQWDENNN